MGRVVEHELAAILPVHLLDRLAHLALEPLHPSLHAAYLGLELEYRLDAGQVEPELGRESLDQPEPLEVGLGVEAGVPRGTLGAHEPLLLIHAQGLRVHPDELGCDGDHVARSVVHHARSRKMRTATELIARRPATTRATATSASAFSQPGRGSPS